MMYGFSKFLRIERVRDNKTLPSVFDQFGRTVIPCGDDRKAGCHRFQRGIAEGIIEGGEDEKVCACIELFYLPLGTEEDDFPFDTTLRRPPLITVHLIRSNHKDLEVLSLNQGYGTDKGLQPLSLETRSHKEQEVATL